MIHKALNMAGKGDVLVVSGGEPGRALMGELMFRYAMSKGLAGIVVDGPIRDVDCLPELTLPIYAAARPPAVPTARGPARSTCPWSAAASAWSPGTSSSGTRTASSSSLPARRRPSMKKRVWPSSGTGEKTEQARHGLFDRNWVDGELSRKGRRESIHGMWR